MTEITPAGWGWHPKAPVGEVTADDLPNVDYHALPKHGRNGRGATLVNALSALPFVRRIQPRHLTQRYGIAQSQASDYLARAKFGDDRRGGERHA